MIVGIDVSPLYTGHKVRGIGFYVKRLLEAFENIQKSNVPAVSSATVKRGYANQAGRQKFKNFKIKSLKNPEDIKWQDYDLLHIPYFDPYFLTLPWPWEIKKPIVVTVHDLTPVKYPNHYPPGIKAKIRWQVQKILLKQAKLIITDSFSSKYDISEYTGYPLDKIYVTYLAAGKEFRRLETGDWEQGIRKKYNLPDKFVLYVGDVNWNKNIPGLVKACQKIDLPLVIVGKQAVKQDYDRDHPENKDLVWIQKKVKQLTINHQSLIIPLGFVPTDDLVALYNLATVYCQPSFDEGFGLPVLEAIACGCPVVSSNQGSLPEVVGEAGLLVEPTVETLAKSLRKVIKSKALQKKLSQMGLKRVKQFSWRKTAQETVEVYKIAMQI